MKFLSLIITVLFITCYSCVEDSEEKPETGTLIVYNETGVPIYVSIGNISDGIDTDESLTWTCNAGPIIVYYKPVPVGIYYGTNPSWSTYSMNIIANGNQDLIICNF